MTSTSMLFRTPHPSHCLIYLNDSWGARSWKSRAGYPQARRRHVPDGEWESTLDVTQLQGWPLLPRSSGPSMGHAVPYFQRWDSGFIENISSGYLPKLYNIPRSKESHKTIGSEQKSPLSPRDAGRAWPDLTVCFGQSLHSPVGAPEG